VPRLSCHRLRRFWTVARERHRTRAAFDALLAEAAVTPHIAAEVDDMAMLRLLARHLIELARHAQTRRPTRSAAGRVRPDGDSRHGHA
jgi:hypothetical protein